MSIERSSDGLIEHQFTLLDLVADADKMSIDDKISNTSKLIGGIHKIAGLSLAYKIAAAKNPDLIDTAQPLALVNGQRAPSDSKKK